MAIAARVVGGLIALRGISDVLPKLGQVRSRFAGVLHFREGDTTSKKVARVACVLLNCAGAVALGAGCIAMGAEMVAIGSQVGFFASVLSGAKLSLPYTAAGLSAMALAALSAIHGGFVHRSSNPAPVVYID